MIGTQTSDWVLFAAVAPFGLLVAGVLVACIVLVWLAAIEELRS